MRKRKIKAYQSETTKTIFLILGVVSIYALLVYCSKDGLLKFILTIVFIPLLMKFVEMFLSFIKDSNAYVDVKIYSYIALLQKNTDEVWLPPEYKDLPSKDMLYMQIQNIGISMIIGLRVILNHDKDSHNKNYIINYQLKTHECVYLGMPKIVPPNALRNVTVIHKSIGVDFPQTFEGTLSHTADYKMFPRIAETRRNRRSVDVVCERVGFRKTLVVRRRQKDEFIRRR